MKLKCIILSIILFFSVIDFVFAGEISLEDRIENNLSNQKYASKSAVDTAFLVMPTAFTPRSGTNNEFKPVYKNIASYELLIYNRYGNLIFRTRDIDTGWNGQQNGKFCPVGAYVYFVKYVEVLWNGVSIPKEVLGTVLLLE